MVDAFFLKLQRDNRKNALAAEPAKEKTGKKAVFSPHCGDETTTYDYNRAIEKIPQTDAWGIFYQTDASELTSSAKA